MLRWAVPEDAHGIAAVHVSSWQQAYRGILSDEYLSNLDRPMRARWWRNHIAEGARVHVVESGETIVGFCSAGDSDDEGWGEVFAIYVEPSRWGEGHGWALLDAAERRLFHDGHTRALLWVLEANARGRTFYERQGWQPGRPFRIEEIGGVQVTELRYEKSLSGDAVLDRDRRDMSP